MKLTEELNKVLTEEERAKYVNGNEINFNGDSDAAFRIHSRWSEQMHKEVIEKVAELKKLYPESFGE